MAPARVRAAFTGADCISVGASVTTSCDALGTPIRADCMPAELLRIYLRRNTIFVRFTGKISGKTGNRNDRPERGRPAPAPSAPADFLGATFAPNELSSAYTVSLTGAVTAAQLTSIAKAIGDSADSNFKGVYISLDLSGASIAENYIPNDTFNASSNADLATYLAGIVLPDTLATLGHRAFKGCTNLSGSVTIPSSCTLIGEDPFLDTGVTSLSDATSGRTWTRHYAGAEAVPAPNNWAGTLADPDAFDRINMNRPDIGAVYGGCNYSATP